MNNLKRVLSLGLSGVMLAGLLTVGASAADFTDADKINHADAVSTLVALNVVNGKEDGSYFDPEGNVTRAEMAKMIAVAMNGGSETTTGVKGTASFSDIKGHWAESYIEYCYDLGIISGRGDGTFDPGANVTGLEAAKMVLTALGYEANAYQLVGDKWASRTDELAKSAKPALFEELTGVAMNAPATRDTAAQLIWNGLQNTTKRVRPTTGINTGSIEWTYEDGDMMLYERYGARIFVGTFDGNDNCIDGLDAGSIQVTGRLSTTPEFTSDDKPTKTDTAKFPSDFDISNIGEKVKVIFKDGNSNLVKNVPDKKDVIYGVFNTHETQVINATLADIGDLKTTEQKLKIDGTKYNLADSVAVITNYMVDEKDDNTYTKDAGQLTGNDKTKKNSALTTALQADTGDTVKFVCDGNGDINAAYVVTSKLAVVVSKNSEKVGINNGVGSIKIADNDVYDDIAVDDVVVVTTLYQEKADDTGAYSIVTKAEKVTGEIDGFKTSEDDEGNPVYENVTLDDKTYDIYGLAEMFKDDLGSDAVETFESTHIGEDFDLYLVNGYVGAAVQVSESASNYSVITDVKGDSAAGGTFDALQLQVMDSNGDKAIITVSEDTKFEGDDGKKRAAISSDFTIGDIVTYTTKGGEATVKIVGVTNEEDDNAGYVKSTKSFNGVVTASNCVLFVSTSTRTVVEGDKKVEVPSGFKAYQIRTLSDVGLTDKEWNSVEKSEKIVAAWVNLGGNPKGATSNTVYGIVSKESGTVKVDGEPYERFIVDVNDEKYTVNISAGADSYPEKGNLVTFEPSSDNTYGEDDVVVLTKSLNGKQISTDNGNYLRGGYVNNYDKEDKIITIYKQIQKVMGTGDQADKVVSYKGVDTSRQTYAVDSDVKVYYVDKDGKKGAETGTISTFDKVNGYDNIVLILDDADETKATVVAMIVEVGGKKGLLGLDAAEAEGGATETASTTPVATAKDGKASVELSDTTTSATLEVSVTTPADTKTVTYKWAYTGDETVDTSSATSNTFTASEAGTYTCTVTNTEDGKTPATCTVVFTVTKAG